MARLARSLLGSGLLLASAALCLGPVAGVRALGALVPLWLPIYAVNLVASAGYPDAVHWFTWPPRFAALWSLLLSVGLLSARSAPEVSLRRALVYVALSCGLQTVALDWARVGAPLPGRSYPHAAPRVTDDEKATLGCLASGLPPRAAVVAERYMQAVFHEQDSTWALRLEHAYARPEVAICDWRSPERECRQFADALAAHGQRWKRGYLVLAGAGPGGRVVERCARREVPLP